MIDFRTVSRIRLVFFGTLLLLYWNVDHTGFSLLDPGFFLPTGLFRIFTFLRPPIHYYSLLKLLFISSLALTALGVRPNRFKYLSFLGLIMAGNYADGFGVVFTSIISVPFFFVLLFFDYERENPRNNRRILLCAQIVVVGHYFFSGLQKLLTSQLHWVFENTLTAALVEMKAAGGYQLILENPMLLKAGLAVTLAAELGSPILLLKGAPKYGILLLLVMMHLLTWHFMPIQLFSEWLLALAIFLPVFDVSDRRCLEAAPLPAAGSGSGRRDFRFLADKRTD